MKKTKKGPAELTLPVAYGNVSVGDKTARISLTIHRGNLAITKADATFTDKRLSWEIKARPNGDAPGQAALPGMEGSGIMSLTGVADVKGIRATGSAFAIGLTFNLKSIDVKTLAGFAKREGDLIVNGIEEIPDEDKGGEESGEED
jgi:hypothetical protein